MRQERRTCPGCKSRISTRFMSVVAKQGARRWRLCFDCVKSKVPHPHVRMGDTGNTGEMVAVDDLRSCSSCEEFWPAEYIVKRNHKGSTCRGCVEAMELELSIAKEQRGRLQAKLLPRDPEPQTLAVYKARVADRARQRARDFASLAANTAEVTDR